MRLKALAKFKYFARRLKDALDIQDVALQRCDTEKSAAAMVDNARFALASVPALTVAEILVKAKALGAVPAAAMLASLSESEAALVSSIIRDIRRMAAHQAEPDDDS